MTNRIVYVPILQQYSDMGLYHDGFFVSYEKAVEKELGENRRAIFSILQPDCFIVTFFGGYGRGYLWKTTLEEFDKFKRMSQEDRHKKFDDKFMQHRFL